MQEEPSEEEKKPVVVEGKQSKKRRRSEITQELDSDISESRSLEELAKSYRIGK